MTDDAAAQIGTNYCTAEPNSTGAVASISGLGSALVARNDFLLMSTRLPLFAPAFFLASRSQGFVGNPGGSAGNLCLGNPIGRQVGGVIVNSGNLGLVSAMADLNSMPQPNGAVVVQSGETWNFQCWYRDMQVGGGATSNFSAGLEVQFVDGPIPIPGMVAIPPGTFIMGSNVMWEPPYYFSHTGNPEHQVTITYPFWIGQHEVTHAGFHALMGYNPSYFVGATRPVDTVTWNEARAYCAALNAQQAHNLSSGYEYRLPTEAEWEYACRAGTTTEFHFGSDLFCNQARFSYSYHSNSACPIVGTVLVGSYAPNALGLYDMHGNVEEWCLDSYSTLSSAAVTDPFVTGGGTRVVRGGGWSEDSGSCNSSARTYNLPTRTYYFYGFRIVLAPALAP